LPTVTFDPAKRQATLEARGLDFADAGRVFDGYHFTRADDRMDYGEERFVSIGWLNGDVVVIVWTPRDGGRRIISMRHANGKERALYEARVPRS
jgi:uncharacterized DUF497 family protein